MTNEQCDELGTILEQLHDGEIDVNSAHNRIEDLIYEIREQAKREVE
jgi:hypothetical protein